MLCVKSGGVKVPPPPFNFEQIILKTSRHVYMTKKCNFWRKDRVGQSHSHFSFSSFKALP